MAARKLIFDAFFVLLLAFTVAQVAESEVLHGANTLGEEKTRQLKNPLAMKDPSAMLTELEEMVHSGEAPAFNLIAMIKSTIQDVIMPAHQATRDAAVQRTAELLNAIQVCNNNSRTGAETIETTTQIGVIDARFKHAACRDAQKAMFQHNLSHEDSYCVALDKFLDDATRLHIPGGSTRADSVAYVKQFCDNNMCGGGEVTELADNCSATEGKLSQKEADCVAKQKFFEEAFCEWKTELENNCGALDICYNSTVQAYNQHVAKTRTLKEKWDVESAAHEKMLCYCNVWLSEKDEKDNRSALDASQFNVCADLTYTPRSMDYGMAAAKAACPLTSVASYPGTSGFITQEYSVFDDFVEQVIPCTEATTAAPTTVAPTFK